LTELKPYDGNTCVHGTAHNKIELIAGSGAVPLRFRSGSGELYYVVNSPCFVIFKSSSASHMAPNYAQRSEILQNNLQRFGAIAVWCGYSFNLL